MQRRILLAGAAGVALARPALAQGAWPNRTIRLIVPYTPGAATDAMARLSARGMVEVNARRGWFVVQPSLDEAREAFGARLALETGHVGQPYARYVFRTTHWIPKAKDETVPNENRLFYALKKGVEETGAVIKFIGVGFLRVTQGRVSLANVSGPITLYDVAGQAGAKGTRYFVWAMAITSVNLGLINLLPIPILDGGTIVIACVDMVTGKRLSPKAYEKVVFFFAFLLIGLFIFLTYNDILRIFSRF